MIDPDRVREWMAAPGENGFLDALACMKAYHSSDVEGMVAVIANCDPVETLKAMISFWEISVAMCGFDPCDVLEGIEIARAEEPDA